MTSPTWVDDILRDAEAERRVRRELPIGGHILLERPLPFLTVYRRPIAHAINATEHLVLSQAAHLVAPGDRKSNRIVVELLRRLAEFYKLRFDAFLILEIWPGRQDAYPVELHDESGELLSPAPQFKVFAPASRHSPQAVDMLARSLRRTRILKQSAIVETVFAPKFAPERFTSLAAMRELRHAGCHVMGIEVRPIFQDEADGSEYPGVLRSMRRSLNRALRQTFFTFARSCTNIRPRHYHTLGRRSFAKVVWETDRILSGVENTFDLLLQATPTNAEAAWLAFRRGRFEQTPVFQYRPMSVDPSELKRRLYHAPIDRIEDPTLALLMREKQDELDRRITMMSDVGTKRFLHGGYQVFGGVDDNLLRLAQDLTMRIPARIRRTTAKRQLNAEEFAILARAEIRLYREKDPSFQPRVEIREDMFSGLLVSQGGLLIGHKALIPIERSKALLQHEIGTHLVTYHNGSNQPFLQLALGLAGYDQLQEGLAVLSEYLVGGLNRPRLRLLAGRVLAVKSLEDGATFTETFRMLWRECGFSQRTAYIITMRVHRAGGLTKDASYLRGLVEILGYIGSGGSIEPLLIGKIAADHIPLIEELRFRQILRPPKLRPRYLQSPDFEQRMEAVRDGLDVLQMLDTMPHALAVEDKQHQTTTLSPERLLYEEARQ